MPLIDLPYEILLEVYKQGGLELLESGLPFTCRRFWQLSFDGHLWAESLDGLFRQCYYTLEQISALCVMPTHRTWFYQQLGITKKVLNIVDTLVHNPESDVESLAWQVISYRLQATVALESIIEHPKTIAHFTWASWLLEVVCRTEGIYRLLDLSTGYDCGNAIIQNPFEHVEALLFLRSGQRPYPLLDAHTTDWNTVAGDGPKAEQIQNVIRAIQEIAVKLGIKNNYYSTLLKCSVFVLVGDRIWDNDDVKLYTFPGQSFCCVHDGEEIVFVDFNRKGRILSIQQVRDILAYAQIPGIDLQLGITFFDILATTYVWRTMPSENRKSILGLIEHAALDVSVTQLQQYPELYRVLVKRIISKNIADLNFTPRLPLSPQPTGSHLAPGMVCQLVNFSPNPEPVVLLEVSNSSCVVLCGSHVRSVLPSMLVPGFDGGTKTVADLVLPDIDTDMNILGQFFLNYDPRTQSFTPIH